MSTLHAGLPESYHLQFIGTSEFQLIEDRWLFSPLKSSCLLTFEMDLQEVECFENVGNPHCQVVRVKAQSGESAEVHIHSPQPLVCERIVVRDNSSALFFSRI